MLDEDSIKRQLHRERTFEPPYCPRPSCQFHSLGTKQKFWRKDGSKKIKRFPYLTVRYRCRSCEKSFTYSFFKIHYRQKVWGLNEEIYLLREKFTTKREIASRIGHDEGMVRARLIRIHRMGLLIHTNLTKDLRVLEPIVYDGIENFSFSQYDPNNINHAVGKESLFIYDFNFAPLNRKGRMSPRQVNKKKILERNHGSYPKNSIRTSTKKILERLCDRTNRLVLYSDKHYAYRDVVLSDLKDKNIEHIKVSSKKARTFKNHLFAVNNIDMQVRHFLPSFKRETIAFSKHSIAMQEDFSRHMMFRNYMRAKFLKKHRDDPFSNTHSPAMILGISDKILSFEQYFETRILLSHVRLNQDALNLYQRIDELSRRPIAS